MDVSLTRAENTAIKDFYTIILHFCVIISDTLNNKGALYFL